MRGTIARRWVGVPVIALLASAIALVLGASPIPAAKARHAIPPDTLVLASSLAAEGKADVILPVGGLYHGKWLSGESWRHKLPRKAKAAVFSLPRGQTGWLRITGPAHLFPPPEFCGWQGTYQVKGDVSGLLAIWRRSGPPVRWAAVTALEGDSVRQYERLAHDYMVAHGLPQYLAEHHLSPRLHARVEVTETVRVDLDYDGRKETLISANWSELNGLDAPSIGTPGVGIRSYLLLVRDRGNKPPSVVALSGPDDFTSPEIVIGCADLDLDGKAEVITSCPTAHAGFRTYQWTQPKIVAHYEFFYGE